MYIVIVTQMIFGYLYQTQIPSILNDTYTIE